NESPNSPTEVSEGLLLTASQLGTFALYTGQLARLTSVLTQHSAGTDFQFVDIARYNILEGDNVNEWETVYTKCLVNEDQIILQAGTDNPYYAGIAKIQKAMAIGLATDLWGDIPNREAGQGIQGAEFYNPAYDPQETIFSDIQDLLSAAIEDLSKSATANKALPGADDLIHGGNPDAWINTAWILKARYALRLSKRSSEAANDALGFLNSANLTGPIDDANAIFGTNGNEFNQWFAFNNERGGYMMMGEFFIDLLKSINDPRLPFLASPDLNGEFVGTPLGSVDNSTSSIGPYLGTNNSISPLVTYVEAKFIEAEAHFLNNDLDLAARALNAAIITHVELVTGESIPADYEAAQASETAATVSLEKIMTHKYVAMFTQVESYSDWRKTGIPALSANPDGVINEIPRRLPTPSVERINNTNSFVTSNVLTPVWWDE
ncbi:MAG: SusD/RagB family nutrient-binding outer membrane lipoprotein, partial [Bacteroidota bacterium]